MSSWRAAIVLMCLFITGPIASSAEIDTVALEKAITSSTGQFEKAFSARDAKGVAALFTAEAEYVDSDGVVFHGQPAIEAEFAAAFAIAEPGKMTLQSTSIRPIAPRVVVEEGEATFQSEDPDGPTMHTRYVSIHVQEDGGTWKLASVRELASPEATPHDQLLELAWLLGRWREETGGHAISSEWKWSDDGNFLISEFTAKFSEEESLKGTHRVGWDAERLQFHSWIFEATGSSAEGWWTPLGDGRWSVQLTGVDADGTRMSSIITYAPDGPHAILMTQDQRFRGGLTLPGRSARIVREPPSVGKSASR